MSAPCVTPESYGPGELCGATTIPYVPAPGLAETGLDLFPLAVVAVALVIVGLVVWALCERLERRAAQADVKQVREDNEALVSENARYLRTIELVDLAFPSKRDAGSES
jgi:hypothetical protein